MTGHRYHGACGSPYAAAVPHRTVPWARLSNVRRLSGTVRHWLLPVLPTAGLSRRAYAKEYGIPLHEIGIQGEDDEVTEALVC